MAVEYLNIELEHCNHEVGIDFWHMNWQTKYLYKMFASLNAKIFAKLTFAKQLKGIA